MKRKKIRLIMLSCIVFLAPVISFANEKLNEYQTRNIMDTLKSKKVLDMNFNNNEIKNEVNNKKYSLKNNTGKLVSGIKGKALEFNGDYIEIPNADLGVENEEYITLSFKYKYGGQDGLQMVSAFGIYDLYLTSTSNKQTIGFNTGNGDVYGIHYDFPTDKYVDVTVIFHRNDVKNNSIYLNGVKQNLTHLGDNESSVPYNPFSQTFYIGYWSSTVDDYLISDKTCMDEIQMYRGKLNDSEVETIENYYKTPSFNVEPEGINAKITWATEILPDNVLWSSSFEVGEEAPYFETRANSPNGHQSYTTTEKYTGDRSLKVGKTTGGNGSAWWYPSTSADYSQLIYNKYTKKFSQGTKLSASMMIKSEKGDKVRIAGRGGKATYALPYHEAVGLKTPMYYLEDVKVGDKSAKVSGLEQFNRNPNAFQYQYVADRYTPPDKWYTEYYVFNEVMSVDYDTNTLYFKDAFTVPIKKGELVRKHLHYNPVHFPETKLEKDNEWHLYNSNTAVKGVVNYDPLIRGFYATIDTWSESNVYMDDFRLGHATKVELFKSGTKIYEGYESEFIDRTAKDTTKPTNVSNIKNTMTVNSDKTRDLNINFNPSVDLGNKFDYSIRALGVDGPSPMSETKSITLTSGLKGYSYLIDKIPTTIPGNTVNLDKDSKVINHKFNKEDTGTYYLHIKAIDNNDNVSDVVHHKIEIPLLETSTNPTENSINLSWTKLNENVYKVYQKNPKSNEFQSISTTDITQTKQLKVLNLYPVNNDPNVSFNTLETITFDTWDGEHMTLPKSASLKMWMEKPNSEDSKGYGKGRVEVTPVDLNDFSNNPNAYLTKNGNKYNYDIVVVGSWDANAGVDISSSGLNKLKEFITHGGGVLLGHDTPNKPYLGNLNSYLDMVATDGMFGSNIDDIYANSSIVIKKKGLITDYPWNIGEVGSEFITPLTHSWQITKAERWLEFTTDKYPLIGSVIEDDRGTNNHYLTTKDNVAMIQTGHLKGEASPDEQKILANTLFYLNQLSIENYLNDKSGRDLEAPTNPTVVTDINNNKLEFNVSSIDKGSTYEYYVEAINKEGSQTTSNVKEETIVSGIKGYSYTINESPKSYVDNVIDTTNSKIITDIPSKNIYLHVKAIDYAGNASETVHIKFNETTKPTLNIEGNPTSWVKAPVTLKVKASDDSGINEITLPSGEVIKEDSTIYTITNNGNYTFKAVDFMGNETTKTINVTKIDNVNPTINLNKSINSNKTEATINITSSDNQSGIKEIILPNGQKVSGASYSYKTSKNGFFNFLAVDNVLNETLKFIQVSELNNSISSDIDRIEYKLAGATVKDWTAYNAPFYVSNEGVTNITVRSIDKAGNVSLEKTSIVRIDKTSPTGGSIRVEID